MKIVELPILTAPRGLYLCRLPNADPTGGELPLIVVAVDDTSDFNYPEGDVEYLKLGEADGFSYTPGNVTGKGTFRFTVPRALTSDEQSNLVAVFDLEGTSHP